MLTPATRSESSQRTGPRRPLTPPPKLGIAHENTPQSAAVDPTVAARRANVGAKVELDRTRAADGAPRLTAGEVRHRLEALERRAERLEAAVAELFGSLPVAAAAINALNEAVEEAHDLASLAFDRADLCPGQGLDS